VVDLDGEAALDATGDDADDDLALRECVFEARPGAGALGLLARESGFAVAILDRVECDFDRVAGLDFDLAALVLELADVDDGFGLEADVDDDDVVGDVDDQARQDHARTDALVG
jgi:hypothetical protein